MPDLSYLRNEIARMRNQIQRQRREIKDLERGGHPTRAANELLERMLARTDVMCLDRDRQREEQKLKHPGTDKVIKGPIERRFR